MPVMSEKLEIRRVQGYGTDRSLSIVVPKAFSEKLRIGCGDFLKCRMDGTRLIVEKLAIEDGWESG
jgi:hypothetical protein